MRKFRVTAGALSMLVAFHGCAIENEEDAPLIEGGVEEAEYAANAAFFTQYQNWTALEAEMKRMDGAANDTTNLITLESMGFATGDGPPDSTRKLWVMRITNPASTIPLGQRESIVLSCGQHAREWISPMVCMWIADRLVVNFLQGAANSKAKKYLNNLVWHIVPMMNPDGYSYSHSAAANRNWRKNRRKHNTSPISYGVDLNRNWGYGRGLGAQGWEASNSYSTSKDSDIYFGSGAFSENETKKLRDYVNNASKVKNLKVAIDFHAYGCHVDKPFLSPAVSTPSTFTRQTQLNKAIADFIAKASGAYLNDNNPAYTLRTAQSGANYPTGTIQDWFAGVKNVVAFLVEVRPCKTWAEVEYAGFAPAASEIKLAAEENRQGVMAVADYVLTAAL